ncbi:hypothetical protein J4050_05380 [Winogradskyella sp. DF17]|uniref:Outer membrane lipoprotein-sorting protein n=2 Tax=Winogradskyella pelagia TaxID=2819984 RepID=A0ABS3T0A3_9FLAO|nr:hypothetical protein [Winogradskyella sp. DF17]
MKATITTMFAFLVLVGCKNNNEARKPLPKDISKTDVTTSIYPERITKVFDAHGGIDTWNTMKTLSFTMNRPNGKEITTTHLKTRAERIDTPTYTLGFDGTQLWLDEKNGESYQGRPWFYKGLMLYFYAMPFIVGDDGINYADTEPLVFEDVSYPGVLISYEANVGESPDDEYIIYYDEQTGQMEWLAYTVTFGKDGKSKDFHFIRYNNWKAVNGLILPKSMDWYNYENNMPTKKRNTVEFSDIILSRETPNDSLFVKPVSAKYIERP